MRHKPLLLVTLALAAAPLGVERVARAYDSYGAEAGNTQYAAQRNFSPEFDPFSLLPIDVACGPITYPIPADDNRCRTAQSAARGDYESTTNVANLATGVVDGSYRDGAGRTRDILLCPRTSASDVPPTSTDGCVAAPWSWKRLSELGWVKARRAWNTPATSTWDNYHSPEHMIIAERAAAIAGFDGTTLMSNVFFVRYPTKDAFVTSPLTPDQYVAGPTYQPTRFSEGTAHVVRGIYLPELTQLPDASYSVWDWAAGNEICPVQQDLGAAGAPRTFSQSGSALYDVNNCHDFGKMVGPLNSSHFYPLNRVYWQHYHDLAMGRMAECRALATAIGPLASLDDADTGNTEAHECEREAMVFEMFAQHFLQDAWSTGHMWKRWGSPELSEFRGDYANPPGWSTLWPNDNPLLRRALHASALSLATGAIHGTKAVTQDLVRQNLPPDVQALVPFLTDDPLCGPRYSTPGQALDPMAPDPLVKWRSADTVQAGVGDYFFDPSSVFGRAREAADAPYKEQRTRLLVCTARSMRDVYLAGPQAHGAIGEPRTVDGASLNGVDAASDWCWGQLATNESMLGSVAPFYLKREWGPGAIALHTLVPLANLFSAYAGGNTLYGGDSSLAASGFDPWYLKSVGALNGAQYAGQSALLALFFTYNALADKDGTDNARLVLGTDEITMLGMRPNHKGAAAPSARPSTYADLAQPRGPEATFPNDYLVRHMFWRSHLRETCAETDAFAITTLRDRCVAGAAGGGDPDACTACVEAAEPRVPTCGPSKTLGASKCALLGSSDVSGLPPDWFDAGQRFTRTAQHDPGEFCMDPFKEALVYCTGVNPHIDEISGGWAERRNRVYATETSRVVTASACSAEPSMSDPHPSPFELGKVGYRAAVTRWEGDPSKQAPWPVISALDFFVNTGEVVLSANQCQAFVTSSLDPTFDSVLAPVPSTWSLERTAMRTDTFFGADLSAATLALQTCGGRRRTTYWNRSCADVALGVPYVGAEMSDAVFPNPDPKEPPELRCVVDEDWAGDRTSCRAGTTCNASGFCIPTGLRPPAAINYLSWW